MCPTVSFVRFSFIFFLVIFLNFIQNHIRWIEFNSFLLNFSISWHIWLYFEKKWDLAKETFFRRKFKLLTRFITENKLKSVLYEWIHSFSFTNSFLHTICSDEKSMKNVLKEKKKIRKNLSNKMERKKLS